MKQCVCQNGATCNHIDGKCKCSAGWNGADCSILCQNGTFGVECAQPCACKNDATCNHVSGDCSCTPGYTAVDCSQSKFPVVDVSVSLLMICPWFLVCPTGTFGHNCGSNCLCVNKADCNHMDGSCTCRDGWIGVICDKRERLQSGIWSIVILYCHDGSLRW